MGKRSYKAYIYCGMLVVLFIAGRSLIVTPGILERTSSYIMYPIVMIQQKCIAPIKELFERKQTQSELALLLRKEREEKEELLAKNIELQACLRYADDIKELVDFKHEYAGLETTLVHVIAKNISDQNHFILIDAGSDKGIEKNMVVVYKNGLIGKVEEVYPLYSKVILITDRSCKVAACCARTNAIGIHEGVNDSAVTSLSRVSHLDKIEVGDLVISSGQGLVFPQGFGLGHVKERTVEGLMYDIEVTPLFDIRAIQHCSVIRKGIMK